MNEDVDEDEDVGEDRTSVHASVHHNCTMNVFKKFSILKGQIWKLQG